MSSIEKSLSDTKVHAECCLVKDLPGSKYHWTCSGVIAKKLEQPDAALFMHATLKGLVVKWMLLILWYQRDKPEGCSELKRLTLKTAERIMIQQLLELESDSIIGRNMLAETPPKAEQYLTEYGRMNTLAMSPLCDWGQEHL